MALLAAFIFSASCGDVEPQPFDLSDHLKGNWVRTNNPTWHYAFDDVFMAAWIHDFGSVITENRFAYRTNGDTAKLTNLETGNRADWLVRIQGDTAFVRTLGAIGFDFKMVRE